MRGYKTFSQLKSLAKKQMKGKTLLLVTGLLVPSLLVSLTSQIAVLMIPGFDVISNILFYIVGFIIQLLAGVLQAGCILLYLHAACDMPCKFSDIFYCLKNAPDKAIKIQFFLTVINSICALPTDIVTWTAPNAVSVVDYTFLYRMCLVSAVGSIVYVILTLGFFPVFYMMHDFPQYTVSEIYKKSWELMKGFKFRYFLLHLSFFLNVILATLGACVIVAIGIAVNMPVIPLIAICVMCVWLFQIMVYMYLTFANFYLDLISVKNAPSQDSNETEAVMPQETTDTFQSF